jgi:superfamily II DNA/RNA helicase
MFVEDQVLPFQLRLPLMNVLAKKRITDPTPIQQKAIPAILAGRNVIAESPTGTGKTLAYLLPLCERLDENNKELQVLILAPTHELAMQITREAEVLVHTLGRTVVALIGGADPKRQIEKLKTHPAVVVGTPGRVKELVEQRKLKLHQVKSVVVDEADRLLDPGFAGPVQEILKRTLRDTQRLFFSATIPDAVRELLLAQTADPEVIKAEAPAGGHSVLHFFLRSEERKKVDTLRRLLRLVNAKAAIVFVNELDKVKEIQAKLSYHRLECRLIHRDSSKLEREQALTAFREGRYPVLIATDVAARGIDIPEVELIVHFDPAADADAYLHRSGRTGRMGAAGLVFSIVTPKQLFIVEKFSKKTGIPIEERVMSYGALVEPEQLRPQKNRGAQQAHKNPAFRSKYKRKENRTH